jgi:hypothetical protein
VKILDIGSAGNAVPLTGAFCSAVVPRSGLASKHYSFGNDERRGARLSLLNLLHFASSREAHELSGGVCKSVDAVHGLRFDALNSAAFFLIRCFLELSLT